MGYRFKIIGCILVLTLFSAVLCACEIAPSTDDWPVSPYTDKDFGKTGVLMEMAYETFGQDDDVIFYTLTNTGSSPIIFDDTFSLELLKDDIWHTAPVTAEAGLNETRELPGMQMCRVDISTSLFGRKMPEGRYRIVRSVGNTLVKAEFNIAPKRINAQEMDFDYLPLGALPANYDAVNAKNDGCYVIAEDGPLNQDKVQRFADKVSLNAPAKLRSVIISETGGLLIRDIIFDLSPDGYSRFLVIADKSRLWDSSAEPVRLYSYMSIAKIGAKSKVCLSNYVSYQADAPAGAALELISPEAPDNIDLVATIEYRVEENLASLPYGFLVYGPDGVSFATIAQGGDTFGYKSGNVMKTDLPSGNVEVRLTGIAWLSETKLSLSGVSTSGKSYKAVYDLETGLLEAA